MPDIYVKNSGTFTPTKELFVKNAGVWKPVKGAWVRKDGAWVRVWPAASGSTTISAVGAYTFTVPNGIYSLSISYPTPAGTATGTLAVTPGQVLNGVIGNFGIQSTLGTFAAPLFNYTVFSFSGNVDHLDYFSLKITGATNATYTGTGGQGTHAAGAAAKGITLSEYSEYYHGDLSSTVTASCVPVSALPNTFQVVGVYASGRYQYELIQQQPTVANNYTTIISPYDPGRSEGYYNYRVDLQQIVPLTISWNGNT